MQSWLNSPYKVKKTLNLHLQREKLNYKGPAYSKDLLSFTVAQHRQFSNKIKLEINVLNWYQEMKHYMLSIHMTHK